MAFSATFLASLGMAALLASSPVLAQPLYNEVFRADTRSPEDVFVNGFSNDGQQLSLLDHVFGDSCSANTTEVDHRTGWISTTGSFYQARAFAARQLANGRAFQNQHRMWIYTIRPDDTYFEIRDVFMQAAMAADANEQGYVSSQASRIRMLVSTLPPEEQQDVVTRRVAAQNIVSAVAATATFDGAGWDTVVAPTAQNNPRFVQPINPMSNRGANLQSMVPGHNLYHYSMQTQSCSQACDGATSASQRVKRSAIAEPLYCASEPSAAQRLIGSEDGD
ncbi:hypothetical protein ACVW0Y_000187 [Pseudomonas sp. TE3786]